MAEPLINASLVDSFHDSEKIQDSIHNLYRYPARFPPRFISNVIKTFSKPGDLIIDPFMGGGTTAIEARLAGRRFLGCDISELACFVSKAKSTPLSSRECEDVAYALREFSLRGRVKRDFDEYYFRNLTASDTLHLAEIVSKMIAWADGFQTERLKIVARCIVLRTAQIAIDGKKHFPTETQFVELFRRIGKECLATIRSYSKMVGDIDKLTPVGKGHGRSKILNINASELNRYKMADGASLLITSPPYPGVHVLYHRWQLKGGKETPLPFFIAGKKDGHGLTHYTMNARSGIDNSSYYSQIQQSFSAVKGLLSPDAKIVQIVAFSEPRKQLSLYKEAMRNAGYTEIDKDTARVRLVPNRRWHAVMKGTTASSREYLLLYRLT